MSGCRGEINPQGIEVVFKLSTTAIKAIVIIQCSWYDYCIICLSPRFTFKMGFALFAY